MIPLLAGWSQDGQITYMDIKVVPRKKYRNDGCYQNHDKNLVIAHDVNAANGPSKVSAAWLTMDVDHILIPSILFENSSDA